MSKLRILHVDDEPDIRELVEMSLGLDPELSVKSCCCGSDAIAEAAISPPDIILMDVMMPVMDGPETLRRLREAGSEVPVVFMTARAQARELAHFLSLGAAGVIAKPFDPMTLAGTVKQYLETDETAFDDRKRRFESMARDEAAALADCRNEMDGGIAAYPRIEKIAEELSAGGKSYHLDAIEAAASGLKQVVEMARQGGGNASDIERTIDLLVQETERAYQEGNAEGVQAALKSA